MRFLTTVLLLVAALPLVWGQKIQINEDPSITLLMTAWKTGNREKPSIAGWRVQLMSSTDRKQVEEGKTKFRAQFQDVHADWVQERPYYKLQVGAFLTKLEALAFCLELKDLYPGAYPAQDNNIHAREFIEQ